MRGTWNHITQVADVRCSACGMASKGRRPLCYVGNPTRWGVRVVKPSYVLAKRVGARTPRPTSNRRERGLVPKAKKAISSVDG